MRVSSTLATLHGKRTTIYVEKNKTDLLTYVLVQQRQEKILFLYLSLSLSLSLSLFFSVSLFLSPSRWTALESQYRMLYHSFIKYFCYNSKYVANDHRDAINEILY